jgi:hypothetical protein
MVTNLDETVLLEKNSRKAEEKNETAFNWRTKTCGRARLNDLRGRRGRLGKAVLRFSGRCRNNDTEVIAAIFFNKPS